MVTGPVRARACAHDGEDPEAVAPVDVGRGEDVREHVGPAPDPEQLTSAHEGREGIAGHAERGRVGHAEDAALRCGLGEESSIHAPTLARIREDGASAYTCLWITRPVWMTMAADEVRSG